MGKLEIYLRHRGRFQPSVALLISRSIRNLPIHYQKHLLRPLLAKYFYSKTKEFPSPLESKILEAAHGLDKGLAAKPLDRKRLAKPLGTTRDLRDLAGQSMRNESANYVENLIAAASSGQDQSRKIRSRFEPDELLSLMMERHSARHYEKDQLALSDEELEQIIKAGGSAPNTCSRQAVRVFLTRDQVKIEAATRQFKGFSTWSTKPIAFMAFSADLRAYNMPDELVNPAIDTALFGSLSSLMCVPLNLSLTMLSWAGRTRMNDEVLRRILGVPDFCEIYFGAVIGRTSEQRSKPYKRSAQEIVYES